MLLSFDKKIRFFLPFDIFLSFFFPFVHFRHLIEKNQEEDLSSILCSVDFIALLLECWMEYSFIFTLDFNVCLCVRVFFCGRFRFALVAPVKQNKWANVFGWMKNAHTLAYKYLHIFETIHATPLRVIKHTTKATLCHIKIKFHRVISGFLHFLKLNLMVKELNYFRGLFLNSFDVHVRHRHCVHSISILLLHECSYSHVLLPLSSPSCTLAIQVRWESKTTNG